jgi:capsular exopolysaccharide synthesis family protein
MNSEQTGLGVDQVAGILRRRGLWILLCCLVVAGAAYGFSKRETKQYKATATVVFNTSSLSQQIAGLPNSGSFSNSSSLLAQQNSDVELVRGGETAAKTAGLLADGLTEEKIAASVSIAGQGESSVVSVSATSTSPTLAAEITNTYVNQFVKGQRRANRQFFKSALALVDKELAELSPAQRVGTDGLDLQDRAHTLRLLSELGYNDAQVGEEAAVPSSPSSPKTSRNTILGLVFGLLLGLAVALLLERFDRRIRRPEDFEQVYDLPRLGDVPKSTALSRSARHTAGRSSAALPAAEAEAFNLIRAHLRFFNVNRDVRTIAIASPSPEDGKTTIACHLANSATRSGLRALLVEADLRHPTVAQQFGIQPGPGLADVLIGAATLTRATQSVGSPTGRHVLDVLTAGAVLPPNPGELLESHTMHTLLDQARETYDLVVVDTPPLTVVSDAFPLLTKVDGVVIVGRLGHSRRDAAEELQTVLAGSGATLLGVIINGAKPVDSSYYAESGGGGPAPAVTLSDNGSAASAGSVPTAKA